MWMNCAHVTFCSRMFVVRGGTPEAIQWEDLARIVPSLDKTVNRQQREDVTKVVNAKVKIMGLNTSTLLCWIQHWTRHGTFGVRTRLSTLGTVYSSWMITLKSVSSR